MQKKYSINVFKRHTDDKMFHLGNKSTLGTKTETAQRGSDC